MAALGFSSSFVLWLVISWGGGDMTGLAEVRCAATSVLAVMAWLRFSVTLPGLRRSRRGGVFHDVDFVNPLGSSRLATCEAYDSIF